MSCVSWFRNPFSSELTQAERDCLAAEGRASIQSVADNVAKYYPDNTDAILAAQQEADRQKAQVQADVNTLGSSGCRGADLSGIGLGCVQDFNDLLSKLSTGARILLFVLVGGVIIYLLALVAPFIPKPRGN